VGATSCARFGVDHPSDKWPATSLWGAVPIREVVRPHAFAVDHPRKMVDHPHAFAVDHPSRGGLVHVASRWITLPARGQPHRFWGASPSRYLVNHIAFGVHFPKGPAGAPESSQYWLRSRSRTGLRRGLRSNCPKLRWGAPEQQGGVHAWCHRLTKDRSYQPVSLGLAGISNTWNMGTRVTQGLNRQRESRPTKQVTVGSQPHWRGSSKRLLLEGKRPTGALGALAPATRLSIGLIAKTQDENRRIQSRCSSDGPLARVLNLGVCSIRYGPGDAR
jgi:hypothetical protein